MLAAPALLARALAAPAVRRRALALQALPARALTAHALLAQSLKAPAHRRRALITKALLARSLALAALAAQVLIVRALDVYHFCISPLLPSACRFHPTCSEYMRQAVEHYGAAKGVWMGVRRLARCHPFHGGGFDPVR